MKIISLRNNLKYFNDFFGHIYGDKLISDSGKILQDLYGNVYRTGGDEFVALLDGLSDSELLMLRSRLRRITEDYNELDENHPIIIEIACGYSVYKDGDVSYESILYRSDEQMYKNKTKIKEVSKVKYERG